MKEISKRMRKVEDYWWETRPGDDIICDEFVTKYFGVYGNETVAYLTIKLSDDGFVLFKRFRNRWYWHFDQFSKTPPVDDEWDDYSLYPEFQKLLQKLSKENGGIQEFRADLYITDLPFELSGEDSLQMLTIGDRK